MKSTKTGRELISALEEALEFHTGRKVLKTSTVSLPSAPPRFGRAQVIRIRRKLRVSQPIFAAMIGVEPPTVRAWEQGLKNPSGSARRVLQLISADPRSFLQAIQTRPGRERKAHAA